MSNYHPAPRHRQPGPAGVREPHGWSTIPRRPTETVTVTALDRALMAIALASCAADLSAAMDRAMMFRTVPA